MVLLTAPHVPSLPFLSTEPVMRRGHGMIYQGLAAGRIDEDALREMRSRNVLADEPASVPRTLATSSRDGFPSRPDPARQCQHPSQRAAYDRARRPRRQTAAPHRMPAGPVRARNAQLPEPPYSPCTSRDPRRRQSPVPEF